MRKTNFADATAAPTSLPSDDAVLDRFQFAALLKVDPRTIYRWHLSGEGPRRVKVGKQVFYRGTAIREWLASNETSPRKPVQAAPRSLSPRRMSRAMNRRRRSAA